MKLEVTVAKATQTAIPELGKKETTLYYLIIGEDETKVVINVGEKTYTKVQDVAMQEINKMEKAASNEIKSPKPTK